MAYNDTSEYGKPYGGDLTSAVDIGSNGVGLKINWVQIHNTSGATVEVTLSGHGGTALPNGNLVFEVADERTVTIPSFYSPDGLRISDAGADVNYSVSTNESGGDR